MLAEKVKQAGHSLDQMAKSARQRWNKRVPSDVAAVRPYARMNLDMHHMRSALALPDAANRAGTFDGSSESPAFRAAAHLRSLTDSKTARLRSTRGVAPDRSDRPGPEAIARFEPGTSHPQQSPKLDWTTLAAERYTRGKPPEVIGSRGRSEVLRSPHLPGLAISGDSGGLIAQIAGLVPRNRSESASTLANDDGPASWPENIERFTERHPPSLGRVDPDATKDFPADDVARLFSGDLAAFYQSPPDRGVPRVPEASKGFDLAPVLQSFSTALGSQDLHVQTSQSRKTANGPSSLGVNRSRAAHFLASQVADNGNSPERLTSFAIPDQAPLERRFEPLFQGVRKQGGITDAAHGPPLSFDRLARAIEMLIQVLERFPGGDRVPALLAAGRDTASMPPALPAKSAQFATRIDGAARPF
jgi:hypothetical protein